MFSCATCNAQFSDGAICSSCNRHFDFQCAGITEVGFRRLGDRKGSWRCPECKTSIASPKIPMDTLSSPSISLGSLHEQLISISLKLAPLSQLIEDVSTIKLDINNLQTSFSMAHDTITKFTETVTSLDLRIKAVEEKFLEIPTLQKDIASISQELQERDQWARINNAEVVGIPQKQNENLFDIAVKIGTAVGYPIKAENINYIARVPTRQTGKPKPIIVAFHSRYIKEDFIAASRKNRSTNIGSLGFKEDTRFFVNDHLTVWNKHLLSNARDLVKEHNYQYIWVKHCKIFVRKSDASQIFTIKNEKDLQKIC